MLGTSIATNPDPNVHYTIIAGDPSIRPEALQMDSEEKSSPLVKALCEEV
ncbi:MULTISPECIES: hypothetical protein [Nostocales]|uniref:Uncharacterized protein n=3 Tax=Nostocales TaxID=1161 RepID=A0A8S9TC81_9CYAN|nr:hypothetical protein [Tolypothrix bouteillei]KAF3889204.1 hypothetical protein DA73_0400029770 [Tolypothrix bouteillei VB521301]